MKRDAAYLRDRTHLLIAGVTGVRTDYGGKTAVASWWADNWGRSEFDVVLFFNPKQDRGPERIADEVVRDAEGAAMAVGDGAGVVTISPDHQHWQAEHDRVRELVQWLADELPESAQLAVVHDEAPEFDGESLAGFVRVDGNGSRCKSLVIAQSPGNLSKDVRQQCVLVWVGPVTGEEEGIFSANQRRAHFDWILANQRPYQWSVLLGPDETDRDTFDPVPEHYAG